MDEDTDHGGGNPNTRAADWNTIESYEVLMALATTSAVNGKGKGKQEGGEKTGEATAQ